MINLKIKKLIHSNEFNLPRTIDDLIVFLSTHNLPCDILPNLRQLYHLELSHTIDFEYDKNDGNIYRLYISPQYHPYGMVYLSCHDIYADIPHKNKIGSISEIVSLLYFSEMLLGKSNVLINEFANIVEKSFSTYNSSSHKLGRHIVSELENSNTYIEFLTCFEEIKKDYIMCRIKKKNRVVKL